MRLESVRYKQKVFTTLSQAMLAAVSDLERQIRELPYFYQQEMKDYLDKTAKEITDGWSPYSPGRKDHLQIRSGETKKELLDSTEAVRADNNKYNARITGYIGGPDHLNILEDGGTISAKGGKYLTIPLPAALDSRGLPLKKSLSEWTNTFTKMSKAGNLVVFHRRNGKAVPIYVLKKSVKYRRMLGMGDALNRNASYFEDRVMDAIERELMKNV